MWPPVIRAEPTPGEERDDEFAGPAESEPAEVFDMELDLFAGLPVTDYPRALEWYPRLLGDVETFDPNDTERVFTLAEHCYVYVVVDPERAGNGLVTLFLDDHDGFVAAAAARGVEPTTRETYDNGVRKTMYHDPEGNEIGIGGAPVG